MKRLLVTLSLLLFSHAWVTAQDITSAERDRATAHLKKTSAAFLKSVAGLSDEQLKFKPGPTRWSVAEVSEHIAAAEDFLMEMVKGKVMTAPARAEPVDVKAIDNLVLAAIPDRSKKQQAPEPLVPNNRFGSLDASLAHFKESRAKTIAFLTDTKDLRGHAIDSPLGKQLDAYEWVLFISAHCERHTKQIEEVKADANFPKA